MRIAICGDIHLCKNSSIIRQRGTNFSVRLENCIKSINWFEDIAEQNKCDLEVFLGDVFDSANLDDETITAINQISWNKIPKKAIVGNHESSSADLYYNSLNVLAGLANFTVYSAPVIESTNGLELCYLPYIIESDREPLVNYFGKKQATRIVFSHNDLCGIQLGPITSKTGFKLDEIEANSDLFINGHLHNGQKITNRIINLGVLTGKDFGENADLYPHNIIILDTDTLKCQFIENPFAFNFYKLEILNKSDLIKLNRLKNNSVLSIKCTADLLNDVKNILEAPNSNVYIYRTIIAQLKSETTELLDTADLVSDHLAKCIECCRAKLENTEILEQELAEICK